MSRGEFKDARKACGLVTPRPFRWAERYGLDPNPSKPYRAQRFDYEVDDWDEAYQILIENQCLSDMELDFDEPEDEELAQNQYDEAYADFHENGYVELNMYNSLSSVLVYRADS